MEARGVSKGLTARCIVTALEASKQAHRHAARDSEAHDSFLVLETNIRLLQKGSTRTSTKQDSGPTDSVTGGIDSTQWWDSHDSTHPLCLRCLVFEQSSAHGRYVTLERIQGHHVNCDVAQDVVLLVTTSIYSSNE
jgi:hypothetical protein